MRAALVRFWVNQRLLRAPVPLTGERALHPDTPWSPTAWVPAFLTALADGQTGAQCPSKIPPLRVATDAPPQGVATLSARASQMPARADKLIACARAHASYGFDGCSRCSRTACA